MNVYFINPSSHGSKEEGQGKKGKEEGHDKEEKEIDFLPKKSSG